LQLSHPSAKHPLLRAAAYTLPTAVDSAVAAVFGVHGLPLPRRAPKTAVASVPLIQPSDLLQAYNVSGVTPSGSKVNRQAVAEFQGELMSVEDLATFFSTFVPNAPAGSDKVGCFAWF
jgi:hypothetical protein